MPPYIDCDSKIPIAYYGESDLALFKRVYRLGLSNRYGRQMQAISGIHYNFSIDNNVQDLNYHKISSEIKVNNFITTFEFLEENNNLGNDSFV